MFLNVQAVFTTVPEMQYVWRRWDSSSVCVLHVTELMKTLMQAVKVYKLGVSYLLTFNTEFFPPRQHIFMHSAHTTFVGTPLPQHSLLSGQTWWGPHTWRDPSGNTVNDIHDPHKPSNRRSKVDVSRIFAQHFLNLDQI